MEKLLDKHLHYSHVAQVSDRIYVKHGKKKRKRNDDLKDARVYTGERLYLYKVSGKTFNQRSMLNGHMRAHRWQHIYVKRGETFRTISNLKLHIWVHNGETLCVCKGNVLKNTLP